MYTVYAHESFAFTSFVLHYAMELPGGIIYKRNADRCRIPSRDDSYPRWFHTIRGSMMLLANHIAELADLPFAPILSGYPVPEYDY
jgi:hypothetical protein